MYSEINKILYEYRIRKRRVNHTHIIQQPCANTSEERLVEAISFAVVENNGMGYFINISLQSYALLEEKRT